MELTLEAFRHSIRPNLPIFGLDIGEKTIGVAISDRSHLIASPFHLIQRSQFKKDAAQLLQLINEEKAIGLIIGLPKNMNGTQGPACQSVRAFARHFFQIKSVAYAFWDERLTTAAAEKALIEADISRKKRKKLIDKAAAVYILQGALDFFNRAPPC